MSRNPSLSVALRVIMYLKWISEQKRKGGGDLYPSVSMRHMKITLHATKSMPLQENHSM